MKADKVLELKNAGSLGEHKCRGQGTNVLEKYF